MIYFISIAPKDPYVPADNFFCAWARGEKNC